MKEHYDKIKPLKNLHKDILRKFREYMCVGGIPQAVVKYAETKDFEKVDFLIRKDKKIIPIEAKSGKTYTLKSLIKFKTKFSNKVGLQYVLYDGDIRCEGETVYLPYYMAAII